MQKRNMISASLILISLQIMTGCGQSYGKMLEFNGGDLYYTGGINEDEANKLGQYLVTEKFYDGNEKTVQIRKNGNTYEFRMVIKKGLDNDQEFIQIVKQFAKEISANVFEGNHVDVHLCDRHLKTLRVVVAF